jgi:predicted cupin superfamily sugar epimerase
MTDRAVRRAVDGTVLEELDVPPRAAALRLEPHPEGGWYRRTWASAAVVGTAGGDRPAATMILFLLPPGEASAWHTVSSDELWLWHGPDPLMLELGGTGERPGTPDRVVLGPDADQTVQARVPAGVWQRTVPSRGETLVSCVVSPGFDFADFALETD